MANNHEQFIAFNDTITSSKRETLKKNRDAIREKIKKYFKENWPEKIQPKFHWQGSYAMFTILNPIKDEDGLGAFDLDDGVYFIGDSLDERETVDWYHKEVLAAVKDHTTQGSEDTKPCVRVNYADGHHVDLPIYFMVNGDAHPTLAHKASPWMDSDPRDFWKWFAGREEHPQLRRIVKYLKAWADYTNFSKDGKMPTGCILTMLAVKHFKANERDDIAMKDVLNAMYNELSAEGGFHCYRPTFPEDEDLFEHYKITRKNFFLNQLKLFSQDASRAVESKNQKDGCKKWQKYFGKRFSCSTAKDVDEDAQRQENSGTIKTNSRFA